MNLLKRSLLRQVPKFPSHNLFKLQHKSHSECDHSRYVKILSIYNQEVSIRKKFWNKVH